jgi:HEAT repeat protein
MFGVLYARTTQKEPSEERRQIVLQALEKFWTENAFKGLCTNINATDSISADDLKTLSRMLCRTSIATLCELLGMAEKMSTRKILIETLMDAARDNPQILIPHLADSRWYLVRNMVFILTHLKCGALLESMAPLISHKDQRVRKEVLKYLIAVAEPKAKTYILKFLRDDSSALRVMAIQFFRKEKLKFALKSILAFVDSYEFEKTVITEKKTVYEAIGELGGETMLPVFKAQLLKKYLLTTPREMESVVCAIAGLQKVPGKESLKILEEGLRAKRAEFRDVIRQSILQITAAMAAPPRG